MIFANNELNNEPKPENTVDNNEPRPLNNNGAPCANNPGIAFAIPPTREAQRPNRDADNAGRNCAV